MVVKRKRKLVMEKEPTKIYFVTWPNGEVMEGSQSSVRGDMSIGKAIMKFLPAQWFPSLDLGSIYYGPMETLWKSMKAAGFKVQSVEIDASGVSY
jgi:hypothetical protein